MRTRTLKHIHALAASVLLTLGVPAPADADPVMVGYYPAFKGLESRLATTPLDHYTHINIAFANPDSSGRFTRDGAMTCMSDGTPANVTLAALRSAADRLRAKGAKILLSVAGGVIPACSGDWAALLRPDKRATLRAGLLDIVDAAGLDGIDIDIEGALLTRIDQAGDYTPFIADLSAGLKARNKLLTVATASYEGGMIPIASVRYFDLIMPMSYDAIGPSWGQAGSEHATEAQAVRDVALWLSRGVRPERLALGLPFYGYGFGKYAPSHDFSALLAQHGEAALRTDVIGRACAGCDYITFNTPATLERKASLAKARAGGVMVWEITQDTPDQMLGRAVARVLFGQDAMTPN